MWGANQMVPKQCKLCNGNGRNFMDDCQACRGQGSVMLPSNSTQCKRCNGTGRQFTQACNICGGSGWSQMPQNVVINNFGHGGHGNNSHQYGPMYTQTNAVQMSCKLCNGNGRNFMDDCPGCSGVGSVMVTAPTSDCARCNGSGRDFVSVCNVCRGCGYAHRIN